MSIFAPVKGLRVYKHPGMYLVPEDSYGVSHSELILGISSCVLVVKRLISPEGHEGLRISVHKQVYEHGMTRDGHSFGVAIDLIDRIPDPNSLLTVLGGILVLLDRSCVHANHFCAQAEFEEFLKLKLEASITRATQDLHFTEQKLLPNLSDRVMGSTAYSYAVSNDVFDPKSLPIVEWFLNDAGAMLCKSVFIYQEGFATLGDGASVQPLQLSGEMSSRAIQLLAEEHEKHKKNVSILNEKVNELTSEIRHQASGIVTPAASQNSSVEMILKQVKSSVREEVRSALQQFMKTERMTPVGADKKINMKIFFRSGFWRALLYVGAAALVMIVTFALFYSFG